MNRKELLIIIVAWLAALTILVLVWRPLGLPVQQEASCPVGCVLAPTETPTPTPVPPVCVTPTPQVAVTPAVSPTPGTLWGIPKELPITIGLATSRPYFKIIATRYDDPQHAGGNHNVYVRVEHEDGTPLYGASVCLAWPSGMDCNAVTQDRYSDPMYPHGYQADYPLYGGSWNPISPGPYNVWVVNGDYGTEILQGLGLPFNQHVNYYVVYRLTF